MFNSGYVVLHRKLLQWGWYSDINTCRLFIHMLLKANWKDGEFRGTTVPRGSFISSLDKLSEETALTRKEIRTAIEHLKRTGELAVKSTNRYSLFTVTNYETYQDNGKQDGIPCDTQGADSGQPNGTLRATIEPFNKATKEEGKENNKSAHAPGVSSPRVYFPEDNALNQAFADYVDMRRQIKSPLTERAVELEIERLRELTGIPFSDSIDSDLAVRILNQAVTRNWRGLYPLSGKRNYAGGKGGENTGTDNQNWRSAADIYKRYLGPGNGD